MLAPLVGLDSLLGAAVFALAAPVLGWVISARHVALALLGAMLWAAGTVAALGAVADGGLGGAPLGVVAAGAVGGRDRVRPPGPRGLTRLAGRGSPRPALASPR